MEYIADLSRRERKRQAVHHSLLEAAAELFRERGIAKTTVDDIARAADVARQTLFNHFPYKEAFALELTADNVEETTQRAHALLEAGTPALDVLPRVAEWVLDAAFSEGELAVVAARELLQPDPDRAARGASLLPLAGIFEAILLQGREEGSVRGDLELSIVASQLSGILRLTMMQVLTRDIEQLRRELALCFEMTFNGIRDRRNE
jgi:AcrR family transcriptional regulator